LKAEQHHLAVCPLRLLGQLQKYAKTGAADVIELGQIDYEAGDAVVERRCEAFLGRTGSIAVEFALALTITTSPMRSCATSMGLSEFAPRVALGTP
jgi:hypothetical protein